MMMGDERFMLKKRWRLRSRGVLLRTLLLVLFYTITLCSKGNTYVKADDNSSDIFETSTIGEDNEYMVDDQLQFTVKKIAYLTFDDGPSYVITNRILDVLQKENVKATFFVVGKEIKDREEILKRIYLDGHSIGLHTFTHKFKSVYRDQESFISEMMKTANLVNEILGITPSAIRFPGGSSGNLDAELLGKLHENNFKVYDWNVNIGDGMNAKLSPQRLIENSKKLKGNPSRAIILAHFNSNNTNTYKALPGIVRYYREQGYEFRRIDEKTPEYYYKLKKN
jgi:peptidoglycan-N-acetylglucosamine deacetylase